MNKLVFLIAILISFSFFTFDAQAKTLPQVKKTVQKSQSSAKSATGSTILVSPKLRADRRALIVYFSNLQNASSVSYSLTYKTSEQEEGVMGSLGLNGSNDRAELLFGTCSKNVCRYHTGVGDVKFEVSYTSKSGKKYLKRYKIKV